MIESSPAVAGLSFFSLSQTKKTMEQSRIDKIFKMFPTADELYILGNEAFLTEGEANDYSKHFNLGKPEVVRREKPKKGKEEAPAGNTKAGGSETKETGK